MSSIATSVVDRLRIEITSSTAGVDSSIRKLSGSLSKLGSTLGKVNARGFSSSMASAGAKTRGFGAKINAVLSSIGRLGSKIGSASMKMLGLGNAFGFAGRSSATLITRFATLASKIGLMYAALFPLFRLFGVFKKLTGLASDLTEIQNVVDVAFGGMRQKVEDFSKTSIKEFGLSEIAAKRFASQYQSMGVAMGITGQQVKSATGFLQKFKTPLGDTAGYDKASASMADMSINLTKLTADMASFYNVEQSTMAKALQSGVMAGNTRPLRQYGLDLTQATLSEWAMKQGLDANVKSMTQAQKAMLRYQYVMANAANAQGDFARTSGTWANQVRILKQQFQQLGTIIGKGLVNAFRPFLRSLNQILSKVISFAEQVFNSLGQIFGWKLEISAGGVTDDLEDASESASDAEDSSGGAADNLGSAADNAKKLNKQLQGFDKLNNLTTSDSGSGGSGGSGGGGGGSGSGGGSGVGDEASDVAVKLTQTESLIKSKLDTLYKLGEWIGQKLTDALNSIPWNDVYKGAENFGKGLAEFLNGLISPELFSALGRTIANSINTALHFLDGFGTTFDWTDFGKSIGAGLNSFFGNIDWGLYIKVNATFGKGIANAFNAAVDETQFEFIGKAIVGYITGAITKSYAMGVTIDLPKFGEKIADAVNEVIQNAPFYLAGATINVWTTGIYDGLTAAISNIKWEQIPKQISRFIDGLKPGEIGESWGKYSKSIVDALYDLVSDENAWHSIGTGIGDAISGALNGFGKDGWEKFGSSIANFCDGLITIIDDTIKGVEWKDVGKNIATGISKALKDFDWGNLGTTIIDIDVAILDLIKGLVDGIDWTGIPLAILKGIGKTLMEADWGGLAPILDGLGIPASIILGVKNSITSYDWSGNLSGAVSSIKSGLKDAFDKLDLAFDLGDEILNGADKKIELGISFVGELVGDVWDQLKKFGSGAYKITANLAGSAWGTIKDVASGFAKIASKKAYTFKAVASGAWKTLKGYVKNPIGKIKDKIANYTARAKGKWSWLVERAKDLKTYIRNRAATFSATAKGKWSTIAASAKQVYNSLKSKTATFTARAGGAWATIKETLGRVAKSFYSKTVTMTLKFVTSGWSYVSSKWNQFKKWLRGNAEGGVLSNGKWKPVQRYASGGMPSSGQLFQAREAGPELVGTIGGHTAVMNNDQIVASVSNGVAKAMSASNAILLQQNKILTNILAKEFGISSKDIFNAVRSENQNYMNRTGNNAFAL